MKNNKLTLYFIFAGFYFILINIFSIIKKSGVIENMYDLLDYISIALGFGFIILGILIMKNKRK